MPIVRTPGFTVLVCMRWPVAAPELVTLTPDALTKLAPYTTRYAETMNIRVLAVGGTEDHLHVLADVPPSMTLEKVAAELQKPTERYLREVLGLRGLTWDAENSRACSISPWEADETAAYVREQRERHATGDLDPYLEGTDEETDAEPEGEVPDWIKGVLHQKEG